MLSIAPSSHHKLSARRSSTKSLRKFNGLLSLSRMVQSESCNTWVVIDDGVSWSTKIHLGLLCDGVTSKNPASTKVRYIEHLFSNRNLNAQL